MLKQIRIYGACNVLISYELVEYTYQEKMDGEEDYAVLHRVQLEPSTVSTLLIDCPLDDAFILAQYESLLSKELAGVTVYTSAVSAI